jgi:hypothetical protein
MGCLSSASAPASGGSSAAAGTSGAAAESGSSAATGSSTATGASTATGSSAATGAGAATGAASGSSGAPAGTMLVPISPDLNGFVGASSNGVGIQGSWYGYGDDWGSNAAPPGVCETKGVHMASQCSSITFPPAAVGNEGGFVATFPQATAGTMCLSGTAAKVIGTDYSNMFGIGIGLDFNNAGGAKMPYNAPMNNVIGFSFHIAGIPAGVTVNVELPTPATDPSGDSWSMPVTGNGDVTVYLRTTPVPALKPSFTMAMQPAFDAAQVESIQFHIATNTTAAISIPDSTKLCVSNFAAVVKTP